MIITTDAPHLGFLSYVYRLPTSISRLPFHHSSFVIHLSSLDYHFVSHLPFRLPASIFCRSSFVSHPHLLSSVFHLSSSGVYLSTSIFRLLSPIFCHLPLSVVFSHLQSSIFRLPS